MKSQLLCSKFSLMEEQQCLTCSRICVGPHIPADTRVPKVRDKRCFLEGANNLLEWV